MKAVWRWTKRALLGVLALIVLAVAAVYALSERELRRPADGPLVELGPLPADSASIAEGVRLAKIRGCYDGCHGEAFSGDEPFREEGLPGFLLGTFVAPDLTVLAASHSDAELERAIRRGVRLDGRRAMAMPSDMFQWLSDEDLKRILAAIRAQPVGEGPPTKVAPGPLARLFILRGVFEPAYAGIDPDATPPERTPSDAAALGAYLARTVCTECHGGDLEGGDDTPPLAVVAGYSRERFGRLMRTGVPASGAGLGLMKIVALSRFSHFTGEEVDALYRYLSDPATWDGRGEASVTEAET